MKYMVLVLVTLSSLAWGSEQPAKISAVRSLNLNQDLQAKRKRAEVFKLVPHLSANDSWKSVLTIRNDAPHPITLFMEFYDELGGRPNAVFFGSDDPNLEFVDSGFVLELATFEIYSIDFDNLIEDFNSLHIFIFTDETESNYSLEPQYNLFSGNDKLASVGVAIQEPGDIFIMNEDRRFDPYTQDQRYRGMAVTNTALDTCQCEIQLFDDQGNSFDASGNAFPDVLLSIPASGKWVGLTEELFPEIDFLLTRGLGYVQFSCDRPVSVLGLAFEGIPVTVSSIPIDYFVAAKTKNPLLQKRDNRDHWFLRR